MQNTIVLILIYINIYIHIFFFFLFQINKVITGVSYFTHRHTVAEEEEWLTAERMAVSIKHIILAYLHKNKLCIPGTDFKELLYNTDTYTFNKIQMVNNNSNYPLMYIPTLYMY